MDYKLTIPISVYTGEQLVWLENVIDDLEEILDSELNDCQYIRLSSTQSISLLNLGGGCRVYTDEEQMYGPVWLGLTLGWGL